MAIDIVNFPINSIVIFHSYVKLPEGNCNYVNSSEMIMVMVSNSSIHDDGNSRYGNYYVIK